MTLVVRRYEQILQQMINSVVARCGLNDITDSSAFKHILAATARQFDEVNFQVAQLLDAFDLDKASGQDLDDRAAEMQPTGLVRGPATKATGLLVFSRAGTSGIVTIPAGTVAKTDTGIRAASTAVTTIANGFQDSAPVAGTAVVAGASGNVAAGTMLRFDSKPAGVDSVINTENFIGGTDAETDDELRSRLKGYAKSLARSNPTAMEFLALGTTIASGQRVRFAHVWEDIIQRGEVILYIDDGSGTALSQETVTGETVSAGMGGLANAPLGAGDTAVGGETELFLDNVPIEAGSLVLSSVGAAPAGHGVLVEGVDFVVDDASSKVRLLSTSALYATGAAANEGFTATYTKLTGLIHAVWLVIYGDPLDRITQPGARAGGVRVRIRVPQVLQQLVEASITVKDGYDKATVIPQVQTAITSYINNLGISGDVVRAEIITAAMEVPGVINILLTTPATDVNVLDDQLARAVLSNVTVI